MDEILPRRSLLGEVFSMNLLRKVEGDDEAKGASDAMAMKDAI